jgi:hypothetical protein
VGAALMAKHYTDHVAHRSDLLKHYRINDEKSEVALDKFIAKYNAKRASNATEKSLSGLVKRFNVTQRLRLLTQQRELVQAIRDLYVNGVDLKNGKAVLRYAGWLNSNHYPSYYKRDIDYIRKSRTRIYANVLKRSYVPVK